MSTPKSDGLKLEKPTIYSKPISYLDADFASKLCTTFVEDGLAVITDIMDKPSCDKHVSDIMQSFTDLNTGIDIKDIKNTWTDFNLPPQTRPGLFQTTMSNIKPVWIIRTDPKIKNIFKILYSKLRNKNYSDNNSDWIVSGDGINVRPNGIEKYHIKQKPWPHVDQTDPTNPLKCIQGQMVLTNTTASFKASPKSYKIFNKLLDFYKISPQDSSNWLRIAEQDTNTISNLVNEIDGYWQIPIIAPAGSFIVWSSTTIHSARLAVKKENPDATDVWKGWRCVVYVCLRPSEDFTEADKKNRQRAYSENLTTNHWGNHIFNKKPGGRYLYFEKRHDTIEKLIKDPSILYQNDKFKPNLTADELKLVGF